MLLAGNEASATSRLNYVALYLQRSGYRCKMAAATAESSVSIKVIGFEVLSAVVSKSTVCSDITPCSKLKVNRRFEEHIASIFKVEK
jgi:hypothetical protein